MTTPSIVPYLLEADRRRPELKTLNTAYACFELLQLTLALAGPEWSFIGKTSDMDGAQVTPAGFAGFDIELTRNDGQRQRVWISGVGMDAAWHVPSHRQVKVIANSSANDDSDVRIHGPARLTPYDIDPKYYRWHNPPVRQERVPFNGTRPVPIVLTPAPAPVPASPPPQPAAYPYPDEALYLGTFQAMVKQAYVDAGRSFPDPNDSDAYRHFARLGYSFREMPPERAVEKHIKELRRALGVA